MRKEISEMLSSSNDLPTSPMQKAEIQNSKEMGRFWILCLILGVYFLFAFFLTGSPCVFRVFTGIPCPGCGLTRAGMALLRLDFHLAFFYHPIIFLIVPASLFIIIQSVIRKKPITRFIPFLFAIGVCLYIVYILRMICFFPRIEPMVYDYSSILGRIIFP